MVAYTYLEPYIGIGMANGASIDTVIERVVKEIRTLKPIHYCFQTQMGDFDQPTMLRQLEVWSRVIMPAVQREIANDPPHAAPPVLELAAA